MKYTKYTGYLFNISLNTKLPVYRVHK